MLKLSVSIASSEKKLAILIYMLLGRENERSIKYWHFILAIKEVLSDTIFVFNKHFSKSCNN